MSGKGVYVYVARGTFPAPGSLASPPSHVMKDSDAVLSVRLLDAWVGGPWAASTRHVEGGGGAVESATRTRTT